MAIYSISNLDQLATILGISYVGDDQDYRKAIMESINTKGDNLWNKLPLNVQAWFNLNVENFHAGKPFIDLPEIPRKGPKLGNKSKSVSIQTVIIESLLSNPYMTNKELWSTCMDKHVITSLNTVAHYASLIRSILRILEDRSIISFPDEVPVE